MACEGVRQRGKQCTTLVHALEKRYNKTAAEICTGATKRLAPGEHERLGVLSSAAFSIYSEHEQPTSPLGCRARVSRNEQKIIARSAAVLFTTWSNFPALPLSVPESRLATGNCPHSLQRRRSPPLLLLSCEFHALSDERRPITLSFLKATPLDLRHNCQLSLHLRCRAGLILQMQILFVRPGAKEARPLLTFRSRQQFLVSEERAGFVLQPLGLRSALNSVWTHSLHFSVTSSPSLLWSPAPLS